VIPGYSEGRGSEKLRCIDDAKQIKMQAWSIYHWFPTMNEQIVA